MHRAEVSEGLEVWLERDGPAAINDALTLERLALAVRVRHGAGSHDGDNRRQLGLLVDGAVPLERRTEAGATLGLVPGQSYRVVAAPLFAVWDRHPAGPEDVVPTAWGPLHVIVLRAPACADVQASPCGVGAAWTLDQLHHSFRTAVVALRLARVPDEPVVHADTYGGLLGMLADLPAGAHQPDVDAMDVVATHPWGLDTVAALVRTQSVREAARTAGVHHSTLGNRLETICGEMGFDPLDGMGRVRLGMAYLGHRLRTSTVLDLPSPTSSSRHP